MQQGHVLRRDHQDGQNVRIQRRLPLQIRNFYYLGFIAAKHCLHDAAQSPTCRWNILAFQRFRQAEENLETTKMMLEEDDADLREMAQEELPLAKATFEEQEQALQVMLLPRDPKDDNNCYLEIRAGAGGDEAAIFAGDLFRMYSRYAERQGWRVSIVSCNDGELGGYKEVIAKVDGEHVYGRLKFESGGHRVQRVPETESQGRVHTSACTVAVLPEVPEAEQIEINPSELKIDTFRASGAGGQHVNKTDSAIRIPPAHRAGGGVPG